MTLKSWWVGGAFAVVIPFSAAADIHQWNATINSQDGDAFAIFDNERRIVIFRQPTDPSQVFSFDAYDGNGYPTDIDLIQTDAAGVTGTIRVKVAPQTGSSRTYGAARVRGINLSTATVGELAGLTISDSLGDLTGVTISSATGTLAVTDVYNSFAASNLSAAFTMRDLAVGASVSIEAVSGAITMRDLSFSSTFSSSTVSAPLTISRDFGGHIDVGNMDDLVFQNGVLSGNIDIHENYAGTLSFPGMYTGTLHFHGDVTGEVVGGTLSGRTIVDGNLNGGQLAFLNVTADGSEDYVTGL